MKEVLIVNGKSETPKAITKHLKEEGFKIHKVTTGHAALKHLRSKRFDLALFDYHLDDISGVDLLIAIKDLSPRIPIVVTSDDEELTITAAKIGVRSTAKIEEPIVALIIDEPVESGIVEIPLSDAERLWQAATKVEVAVVMEVLAKVIKNKKAAAKIVKIDKKILPAKLRNIDNQSAKKTWFL